MPKILLSLLLISLLSACVTQPEKTKIPSITQDVVFSAPIQSTAISTTPWWLTALDARMQEHVSALLEGNLEIQHAISQVAIDRAKLNQAEAIRWLDIKGNAQSAINRNDSDNSDTHSIGVNASLPLDLFDRLAKSRDAASYDLAQSLAKLENQRLQSIQKYLLALIDGSEAVQLQSLLNQQIKTAETLLRLTEFRFSQGLASSVDVLQQREQLASLKQQIPGIALQQHIFGNLMSEFLGNTPTSRIKFPHKLPQIKDAYAISTPQQLLDHRPDLIAQRAALSAADQRYEAALRERLPSLSLNSSALLRLASGNPSAILGAAIDASLTLFDSGALNATIAQQNAALEQSGIEYLQAWLSAVRETDDLINSLTTNKLQLQNSNNLGQIAGELFEAAQHRYKRGISDYLPVLAALRSLQQQQRDHLSLQAEQQRIRVKLHTAMGLPVNKQKTFKEKP